MKKKLSVLMPVIRPTAVPMFIILIALSAAQFFLFRSNLERLAFEYTIQYQNYISSFVGVFDSITPHPQIIFTVAFGLLTVLLAMTCLNTGGSDINYTLKRLSVSELEVHVWWGAYYCLCYIILCVWQAATMYGLYQVYLTSPFGAYDGGMTFFLACYRIPLLHSIMPLADISRYISNIILLLSLGVCLSLFSYSVRRGKKPMALIVIVWLAAFFFPRGTASLGHDAFLSVVVLITTISAIVNVFGDFHE